jgi:hypothetical protein
MNSARRRLTPFEKRVLEVGFTLYVAFNEGRTVRMRENSPQHRIAVAFSKRMKTAKQREQVLLSCLANLPQIPDKPNIPVTPQFMVKLTRAWQEGKPLPFTGIEFYLLRNWDGWEGSTDEKNAAAPPLKRWTDECVTQLLNLIASDADLVKYRKGKHGELTVPTYRPIRRDLGLRPEQPPLVRQFDVSHNLIKLKQAKPAPRIELALLR